jgi:site-specific DNA recombinase
VQQKLDTNRRRHAARKKDQSTRAPLTGRIFGGNSQPMSPSFTHGKRGQAYRYYVSAPLQQGRRPSDDSGIDRVSGPAIETMAGWMAASVASA